MSRSLNGFSIAIPAYGRPFEYRELLLSILNLDLLPNEVIICEDFSKERVEIRNVTDDLSLKFGQNGIKLTYIENETNLGYDANIRKLISEASFKWVVLIGNDDLFLKGGLTIIDRFCTDNPDISMISRPFIRFERDINKPLGLSNILKDETILKIGDSPMFIFRSCGFVGGLVINRDWAVPLETSEYDGTLYYQIYLAAHAFCTNGIGYLNAPTVGGRTGNPPLFGLSSKDGEVHVPGSYSAKGRGKMWKGVLDISKNVGELYSIDLYTDVRKELMIRQSFHIFEMNVGVQKKMLIELKNELQAINLFSHWVPKVLYAMNLYLGRHSYYFYFLIRKIFQ